MLAVRLAARLVRPRGRTEVVSAVWVVAATAITVVAALTVAGLLSAYAGRHDVLVGREIRSPPAERSGPPLPLGSWTDQGVGTGELVRLALSPQTAGVGRPTWLSSWPRPGEVALSPAAARLRSTSPLALALTPGRVVGAISAAGLRDPDEAVAVVGTTRRRLADGGGAQAVSGFGKGSSTTVEDFASAQLRNLRLLATGVVGTASGALLFTVARLSSAARQRRVAVLQLLGGSTGLLRRIAGLTTAGNAVVGASLGLAVTPTASHLLAGSGLLGSRWWVGDAVSPHAVVATAGSVIVAGVIGSRTVDTDPWRTRQRAPENHVAWWRLCPLVLSLAALSGVLFTESRHPRLDIGLGQSGQLVLFGSLVGCVAGLVLAAPLLVRATARCIRRSRSTTARLAAARADHHARATARLSAALITLVMATGVAIGAFAGIAGQTKADADGPATVRVDARYAGRPVATDLVERLLSHHGLRLAVIERSDDGAVSLVPLRSVNDRSPHDVAYRFTFPAQDARDAAAVVVQALPETPSVLTSTDPAQTRIAHLSGGLVVAAMAASALIALLAVGLTLLALQEQRIAADTALMMAGLTRGRLRVVRGWEVLVATTPGLGVACLVAAALATAIARVDHSGIAAPTLRLAGLGALALGATGLMAIAAALATPALDPRRVAHD